MFLNVNGWVELISEDIFGRTKSKFGNSPIAGYCRFFNDLPMCKSDTIYGTSDFDMDLLGCWKVKSESARLVIGRKLCLGQEG